MTWRARIDATLVPPRYAAPVRRPKLAGRMRAPALRCRGQPFCASALFLGRGKSSFSFKFELIFISPSKNQAPFCPFFPIFNLPRPLQFLATFLK